MKAVAMKVYFVENEDVKQEVVIAPSKRAVTKQLEERGVEILKQTDVTDNYKFTTNEVLKALGSLFSDEQKELLGYILKEAGVE